MASRRVSAASSCLIASDMRAQNASGSLPTPVLAEDHAGSAGGAGQREEHSGVVLTLPGPVEG